MDSLKQHFPWEKKTYIFRLVIKCFYKYVILLLNDYGVNKYVFIILRHGHSARRGHAYMGRGKGRGAEQGEQGVQAREGTSMGRGKGRGARGAGRRKGKGARGTGAGRGVRGTGAGRGKGRGARGVGAGRGVRGTGAGRGKGRGTRGTGRGVRGTGVGRGKGRA